MLDIETFFAQNEKPDCFTGPDWATYAFGGAATPKFWDLRQAVELGRGNPVFAHFKITTTFTGDAGNYLRPCIIYSNSNLLADLLTNARLVVARGPDTVLSALVAGVEFDLELPAPNALVGGPMRYLALGFQALCPANDFTAGGFDAWLSPYPRGYGHPSYASGY